VTPELPEQTTDTNVGVPESQAYAFLEHWSLEKAHVSLAAHRENSVYRVDTPQGRSYALRIRRVGYRTDTELISELDWMTMLAKKGLRVPLPVAASDGSRMVCIGKDRADLVTWLNGKAIGASGESLTLSEATNTFRTLGKTAARLHLLSDQWTMPAGFNRPRWDSDALFGESPLWGRFWDCAELSQSDAGLFTRFREAASKALNSVFGYRLFEIATALVKNVNEPQYPAIRDALIEGYRELRPMNTSGLDLFMATRAATYVGWSAARLSEPGGQARFDRVTRAARDAASHWLSTSQYAFYQ